MFESIIKDNFNIDDSSSDDEEEKKQLLTKKEWLNRCLKIYDIKNPIKEGRIAGPSQRKLNKLDEIDQAKILKRRNQIRVAQREDGLMSDETGNRILDQMLIKYSSDGYYKKVFNKIIKEINKSERRSIYADTSMNSFLTSQGPSQPNISIT